MPNNNEKGADYERQVCSKLSLWVSGFTRDDLFWRSAMSGGRANVPSRKKRGYRFDAQVGDIVAVQTEGYALVSKFCIECKAYRDMFLQLPIFGSRGNFVPIWEKLLEESDQSEKLPLLIFRQNRQPEIVVTTPAGLTALDPQRALQVRATYDPFNAKFLLFRDLLSTDFAPILASWNQAKKVPTQRLRLSDS
jgi:hypothetical protein